MRVIDDFCFSFLILQVFYDKFRLVKVTLQKNIQDNVFFKCFTFRLTTVVSYLNLEDLKKLFFFSQNCVPLQKEKYVCSKGSKEKYLSIYLNKLWVLNNFSGSLTMK